MYYANMLKIGITSRALFDLDSSHEVYINKGLEAYRDYQISREDIPLKKGQAFSIVEKLLRFNDLKKDNAVEVFLLSRNSADTGLRIFNSIQHYKLNIKKAAFCSGSSPHIYANSFGTNLFLSTELEDCQSSLSCGIASARILKSNNVSPECKQLRVAFDADSVIFSDESQIIFDNYGLDAFNEHESKFANVPLSKGPFASFLNELCKIQKNFPQRDCPIRIALVTARSSPSHKRVIKTLRDWNIRIDESLFLEGMEKKNFLKAFKADIFFDDRIENCISASSEVLAGHVVNIN